MYRSDVVGSLLRPAYLKDARERHDAGELSDAAFKLIDQGCELIGCSTTNPAGRVFCSQFWRFKASTSAKSCVLATVSLFLIRCSLESTPTG